MARFGRLRRSRWFRRGLLVFAGVVALAALVFGLWPASLDRDWIPQTWRVVLPGYTDELMISLGRLQGPEGLAEARRKWRINERAKAVGDGPGFSGAIRDTGSD